jgi:predicted RNA-binding Zn ribbon-like protein
MDETEQAEHEFEFIAGNLSVDFTNTVSSRKEGPPREYLTDYPALVAWARQGGVLSNGEAAALRAQAATHPADAAAVVEEARVLREALYGIFTAGIEGRPVADADLAALNTSLERALAQAWVVRDGAGLGWGWCTDLALDRMLWPVARSGADLLTGPEAQRVSECMSDDCGWLFLDQTRNHSRHWCSMDGCGNRAKARRHYARRKKADVRTQ